MWNPSVVHELDMIRTKIGTKHAQKAIVHTTRYTKIGNMQELS